MLQIHVVYRCRRRRNQYQCAEMDIMGKIQEQTCPQRVTNGGPRIQTRYRLFESPSCKNSIEACRRVAMTRQIDVINLEAAVRQRGTENLHELFVRIQSMNDQYTSPRFDVWDITDIGCRRLDRKKAVFSNWFQRCDAHPGQYEEGGRKQDDQKPQHQGGIPGHRILQRDPIHIPEPQLNTITTPQFKSCIA